MVGRSDECSNFARLLLVTFCKTIFISLASGSRITIVTGLPSDQRFNCPLQAFARSAIVIDCRPFPLFEIRATSFASANEPPPTDNNAHIRIRRQPNTLLSGQLTLALPIVSYIPTVPQRQGRPCTISVRYRRSCGSELKHKDPPHLGQLAALHARSSAARGRFRTALCCGSSESTGKNQR